MKNTSTIVAGILLGVLAAWLLGLFNSTTTPAAATTTTKPAANPFFANQPVKIKSQMTVVAPVLPPAPVAQAAPATPGAPRATPSDPQQAAMEEVRQQSRAKAMKNNLRQLATAASQYMLDKGVTSASYFDLVGDGTDDYIRSVNPVMGEDYTGLIVSQTDTEVMVVAPDGTVVTYDM